MFPHEVRAALAYRIAISAGEPRLAQYYAASVGDEFNLSDSIMIEGEPESTLIPFIDKVTYVQDLREEAIDVPPQECFTSDEVKVTVDGVIYIQITDPIKACYGIVDYRDAAVQLAKTTTRSVIGTLPLDRTFEERDLISAKVVEVLDQAGNIWGIRVHRYEIKNITPPTTVRNAMEKQVTAERDRRAILAASEGERQSKINRSEGVKKEVINIVGTFNEGIPLIIRIQAVDPECCHGRFFMSITVNRVVIMANPTRSF